MTIRKKIYSVIVGTFFLLACIYSLIQYSMGQVNQEVHNNLDRQNQKTLVFSLKQNTSDINLLGMDIIVDKSSGVSDERRKEIDVLSKAGQVAQVELSKTNASDEVKNALSLIQKNRNEVILAIHQLVKSIDEKNQNQKVYDSYDDVIDDKSVAQQELLDSLLVKLDHLSIESNQGLMSSLKNSNIVMNILFFLAIIIFTIALLALLKSILASINSFRNSMQEILQGDGDLTRRIELKNKDEMQELASLINSFFQTLQVLVGQVKEASVMISAEGEELNKSIHKVKDSSLEVSDSISHSSDESIKMNQKFEELSSTSFVIADNIQSVSAAIEELSASMNEIGRNAGQSTQVANTALQSTLRALETIQNLGTVAQNINSISDYISEIAEQTNLLSLNAAIEAAGAGEAGKGFAVVASEVKELAKQAQNASRNIIEQIRSVQEGAVNAVQEVQSISNVMRDVNDFALSITAAVEEQSSVTRSISMNVQEVNSGSLDVKDSIVKLTQGTERLNHNFSNVNEAIEKHEVQTQNAAYTTQRLLDLAENLKTSVNRFNV
jgi:methyl-accepting chemotaxis protein